MSTKIDKKLLRNRKNTDSFSVTLNFVNKAYPDSTIKFIEMSADHRFIGETVLEADRIPTEYVPGTDTEYIITERFVTDFEEGVRRIERNLYSREDTDFRIYTVDADGICTSHYIGLLWD